MEPLNAPQWLVILIAVSFVLCNLLASIIEKVTYIIKSNGTNEYGYHSFTKPYFYTATSMLGTALSIVVYVIFFRKSNKDEPLFSCFFSMFVPGILDLFQVCISCVTIAYVGLSIDYMLKSGSVVGVAIIAALVFKRKFKSYQIAGLVVVMISLFVIGLASLLGAGRPVETNIPTKWVAVILFLKILSEFGYAGQMSYEQYFTQKKHLHPTHVTGLEGIWSFLIAALIILPVLNVTPGSSDGVLHEDIVDSFVMIKNNLGIIVSLLFVIIIDIIFTVISVYMTALTSAVTRILIELLGTILVWVFEIVSFKVIMSNPKWRPYADLGEEWTNWSWLELGGYLILIIGLLIYHGTPKIPCFDYKSQIEDSV